MEAGSHVRPAGRVSNVLHHGLPVGSELDVSMPFGDFVLDLHADSPVVLMSSGVGLTLMMAMLRTLTDRAKSRSRPRQVVFVRAARNGKVHAMKSTLTELMAANYQIKQAVFYEQVAADDVQGKDYDFHGQVDLHAIRHMVLLPHAHYYICGPAPFMKLQSRALQGFGVPLSRIHMEVFSSPGE